ncbi:methyltransferase [Actinomyces sp. 432]|uniref:methyltransferase n=1 Tax=Actinomyces sp. 432 TaxID=2057798 RepID=UPI003FA4BDEC
MAREVLTARVWAVEIASDAVALARENCERLAPGRVEVIHGDATDPAVLAEMDGRADVVVSNPPYVPAGAVEDTETAEYDPHVALYGGERTAWRLRSPSSPGPLPCCVRAGC